MSSCPMTAPTVRLNCEIRCAWTPGTAFSIRSARASVSAMSAGSTSIRRDRLVGDAEQLPRHADVHHDRRVDDERAGLVEADDRELLAADPERLRRPSWACRRRRGSRGRSWC